MEEHDKTKEILHDVVLILKNQQETFSQLLTSSESRIDATNRMIQQMSHTCGELAAMCRDLKESYVHQFEEATSMNRHLIEECARMQKENEAYYESVKKLREEITSERARYDNAMSSMVAHLCSNHSKNPLVNIDQK